MFLIRAIATGLSILIILETVSSASGPYCAICEGDHSIGDCKKFHLCPYGQKCYLQKFLHEGKPRFYGGCAHENTCNDDRHFPSKRGDGMLTDHNEPPKIEHDHGIYQCGGCCDGNECNLHLCGQKSNVIFCAVCRGESSITQCNHFAECPDQECYLQVLVYTKPHFIFGRPQHKLYGGCASSAECQNRQIRESIVGHNEDLKDHHDQDHHLKCQQCCHDDSICNVELCEQKQYFHLPTHQTTTTTHEPVTTDSVVMTMETTTQAPPPTTESTTTQATSKPTHSAPHTKAATTAETTESTTAETTVKTTQTTTSSILYCAACNGTGWKECADFTICPGEHCYMEMYNQSGKISYFGGCATGGQCANLNTGGSIPVHPDKGHLMCTECCNEGSMCNFELCKGGTVQHAATGSTISPHQNASSTKPPAKTIQCHQCSGKLCGVLPDSAPVDCPHDKPFCLNTMSIDDTGARSVIKRCGADGECQRKWWLETSDSAKCMAFNPLLSYPTDNAFTCHYCCTVTGCNKDILPPDQTLFSGHSK